MYIYIISFETITRIINPKLISFNKLQIFSNPPVYRVHNPIYWIKQAITSRGKHPPFLEKPTWNRPRPSFWRKAQPSPEIHCFNLSKSNFFKSQNPRWAPQPRSRLGCHLAFGFRSLSLQASSKAVNSSCKISGNGLCTSIYTINFHCFYPFQSISANVSRKWGFPIYGYQPRFSNKTINNRPEILAKYGGFGISHGPIFLEGSYFGGKISLTRHKNKQQRSTSRTGDITVFEAQTCWIYQPTDQDLWIEWQPQLWQSNHKWERSTAKWMGRHTFPTWFFRQFYHLF